MRILIADDSALVRAMLTDTLEGAGYEVVAACDGTEAWEALATRKFRLAILDWMMPGMNGPEICERLRTHEGVDWIYVVLITAIEGKYNVSKALGAGASDYVRKPIEEHEILSRIAVGRRMIELQTQLVQAQKLESVGQLAAGIAHEINTPIQYVGDNTRFLCDAFEDLTKVLKQYESLLESAKQEGFNPQVVGSVESLLEECEVDYLLNEVPLSVAQSLEGVEQVATIVRSMKEFSHPGSSEKVLVDLNSAIQTTITVARNEWKYVSEVETELASDLPRVPCLPADINQVILNLIVNAAHAIADQVAEGSGDKGTITIRTRRCGDWAEFSVGDSGTGIPAAIQRRIFDPFFTTKEVGKGTGQGLAMVHSVVVEKHHGTIDFDTAPGEGTTFFVRLPVAEDLETQELIAHGEANPVC